MTDPLFTAEGQFAKLYLAIHKPSIILSAQVAQSFSTLDNVTEIMYDNVTAGTYTNVKPNMKVLVGSTAGAWDLGIGRIRKAAAVGTLYIGRQSDIQLADNVYLTVLDDFWPCARQWYVFDEAVVHMDEDVAYVDQNVETEPVPVMGPDAVVELTGASVTHARSAVGSWTPDASALSYLWTATGPAAVTIVDDDTATPTFSFTVAGEYRIALTVTTANGKSTTGYRRTFVFGGAYLPITNFELESLTSSQEGGTSFKVTLHDNGVLNGTYDQAKIILFAKDVYNTTTQSFGPLVGYENIVAWGWCDQNLITWSPDHSTMSVEVKGPAYWIDQIDILAAGGLKSTPTTPTGWLYAQSVTVDKVLHNLLHWRSNIDTLIDVFPSSDTRVASGLIANNGSLWEQVKDIAGRIFAVPVCDRYGRLSADISIPMVPIASRSTIPTIMAITKPDWQGDITITQRNRTICSQVYLGGTDDEDPFFSKAPGTLVLKSGKQQIKDNILVADQAQANQLAGDLLAWQNNQYPSVVIPLRANNRLIDVASSQYVTLSVASTDTPLGIVWTNKKLIPKRVTYQHDPATGELGVSLECEADTNGVAGVTYIPPEVPVISMPPGPGGPGEINFPPLTLPGLIFTPRPPAGPKFWYKPDVIDCKTQSAPEYNGPFFMTFSSSLLTYDTPIYGYLNCWIRTTSVTTGKTYMLLRFSGVEAATIVDELVAEAIDGLGDVVMSASSISVWSSVQSIVKVAFEPVVGVEIAGIKLSLSPGGVGYGSTMEFVSSWISNPDKINNSSYLGNGKMLCGVTNTNTFYYYFDFLLRYEGADLQSGSLRINVTHLYGTCTNTWTSGPGFHYIATAEDWPTWWASTAGGRGPVDLLSTWTFGYVVSQNPGASEFRHLTIGFGFRTLDTNCLFQINYLTWPWAGHDDINLWPYGSGVTDNRKHHLAQAAMYNICKP